MDRKQSLNNAYMNKGDEKMCIYAEMLLVILRISDVWFGNDAESLRFIEYSNLKLLKC